MRSSISKTVKPLIIEKERILIVEGNDEKVFFTELFKLESEITNIQIIDMNGKDNLRNTEKQITLATKEVVIKSVGIVMDADNSYSQAAKDVENSLERIKEGLKLPINTCYFIMPDNENDGMLETLLLKAVQDDKNIVHVDDFIDNIRSNLGDGELLRWVDKRKVLAYLLTLTPTGKQGRKHIDNFHHNDKDVDLGTRSFKYFNLESEVYSGLKAFIQEFSLNKA